MRHLEVARLVRQRGKGLVLRQLRQRVPAWSAWSAPRLPPRSVLRPQPFPVPPPPFRPPGVGFREGLAFPLRPRSGSKGAEPRLLTEPPRRWTGAPEGTPRGLRGRPGGNPASPKFRRPRAGGERSSSEGEQRPEIGSSPKTRLEFENGLSHHPGSAEAKTVAPRASRCHWHRARQELPRLMRGILGEEKRRGARKTATLCLSLSEPV